MIANAYNLYCVIRSFYHAVTYNYLMASLKEENLPKGEERREREEKRREREERRRERRERGERRRGGKEEGEWNYGPYEA